MRFEVRISLRCHDRRTAVPIAFQLWQRALDLVDNIVAAKKHLGYTEFMAQLTPESEEKSVSSTELFNTRTELVEIRGLKLSR